MKRFTRATPLFALLTLACGGGQEPAVVLPYVGPCDGLAPLSVTAEPTTVRSGGVATLAATGGSDDHGSLTGYRLGGETTSEEAYQDLLSRVRR